MALPKNKKIRRITVDGVEYYWTSKYDEIYGQINCNIGLVEKPNYRFSFLRGLDSSHTQYIHNGISEEDLLNAITPKLISDAIKYANKNLNWQHSKESWLLSNSKGFSL